ncbi:MAG: DUF1801 domain-containing protein [Propionibacteriaceae bacterium]|jgi:uncharacterized protein YdhG (YjbR/CyaY superfamily)|nr:DUF1801 domain-containing protein [Propionibacteriaceae bacterium]
MATTIDEYLATLPLERADILGQVRQTLKAALPEASERISWQMPTFWQGRNIIHFAGFVKHWSLFPGPAVVAEFTTRLDAAGIAHDKGTIRFPWDAPLDNALVADVARAAAAERKKS